MREYILLRSTLLRGFCFVILTSLFLSTGYTSVYASSSSLLQADETVSGKVLDENGDGLPGVNVLIEGTATGTITDLDGNFEVQVPENAVLIFSFIGYESKKVTVGSESVLSISMTLDFESLEEVVVVGFAEQKKASVVGSIVTTDGESVVRSGGVTTVSEALTGLLPGVTTTQNAGIPGASQTEILIRGKSSWNDNSPLYLVDGVERDFNNMDPNEIESVTVLKDASATAIFGARAGNGAVIITTKKGKTGKVSVNFSANFGLKTPTTNTDYLAPYDKTLEHYNIAARNDRAYGQIVPQQTIDAWADPNRDPRLYSYTDWVDELLQDGYSQSYNLNIQGGNEFVRYFTSFGYNSDGDIFALDEQPDFDPRTWQKRYNYRANIDVSLTKTTEVSLKLAGEITNWNGNSLTNANGGTGTTHDANGSLSNLYLARLYQWPMTGAPPQFDTGEFGTEFGAVENPNFLVRLQQQGNIHKKSNKLWTDFGINQDLGGLVEGLSMRGKVAFNSYYQYRQNINANEIQFYAREESTDDGGTEVVLVQDGNPDAVQQPPRIGNEDIVEHRTNLYYEAGLAYDNSFGDHSFTGLALFNRTIGRNKTDFQSVLESWVGRVTYDYDNRYFVEFNGAYNGSEKFAPGKRFGFFPSGAVGWLVTNEDFMEGVSGWLDHLKVRYSYGIVGSEKSANRFAYLSVYEQTGNNRQQAYFGDPRNNNTLYGEGKVPNAGATWEESVKQNLGIEFGFLNSRLTSTIELYDEQRTNIFLDRKTSSVFSGFQETPQANIGSTKSHGVEFELSWKEAISSDFSYYVTGNLSLAENRVIEKDDAPFAPEYQKEAGKPIGSQYGLLIDSYLDSRDEVYNTTESSWSSTLIPGDFQYIDYNADGIINQDDRVIIRTPNYAANAFAMTLGATWKGLSVMARFNGVFNISKELSRSFLWEHNSVADLNFQLNNNEQQDAWTPDNLDATHPALHVSDNHNPQRSTHTIRRSDYMKLQTAEISYRLPVQNIQYLSNFEVYVNGNNLWTWTDLPDAFDPEAKNLEVYPISRRYNIGFRMSF
ncbi:MAG: TonB-dependent receptor [Reichenbachiella sp.]